MVGWNIHSPVGMGCRFPPSEWWTNKWRLQNKNRERAIHAELAMEGKEPDHHLCLAKTQRQAAEWGSFMVEERKSLRCVLIGGCQPEGTGGGLLEVKHPMWLVRRAYLAFCGYS